MGNVAKRARLALLSPGARTLRFAVTGGLAGITQLALLEGLSRAGWDSLVANATAFLLAAQLNFFMSSLFTWRDRLAGQRIARRWLAFHAAIAGMALVNMVVFAITRTFMPPLAASVAGILAGAVGNFLIGDRLVFVRRGSTPAPAAYRLQDRSAA
jgi:putative flippase GtrA